MKISFIIPFVFAALAFTGCNSGTETAHAHDQAGVHAHSHDHDAAENKAQVLSLNNGKKWKADEPTTAGILQMRQIITTFPAAKSHQELGEKLNEELNLVFKNCTMKGPAHDELHKFLEPIIADVKVLQEPDADAATHARHRLEERLMMYQTFFE